MHRKSSSASTPFITSYRRRASEPYEPTAAASRTALAWAFLKSSPFLFVLLGGVVLLTLGNILVGSGHSFSSSDLLGFVPESLGHDQADIELPTFGIIYPSQQLTEDLHTCAELCGGGRSIPSAVDLQPLNVSIPYDLLEAAMASTYGEPVPYMEKYPKDWPFLMHQTDQFSLQSIVSLRLQILASACPTATENADFLFLGLDTRAVARCLASCPHRDSFPPDLNIQDLKLQVREWLLDTVHEHRSRRPYPSIVLSLALIDHDYESNILSEQAQEVLKDEVVVLGIERAPWVTEDKLTAFEQMPYPSTMHLPLGSAEKTTKLSKLGEWQLKQERTHLISFAGKSEPNSPKSGQGPHNGFALRRLLTETLVAHMNDTAADISLQFFTPSSPRSQLAEVHQAMARSTFCLQPPGDSPTRKGFFDSILLGCIPVIFRRGTYEHIWKGQVELEELAVVIDEKELLDGEGGDVVERLRLVDEEVIKQKREAMVMLAERVQYAAPMSGAELLRYGGGWTDDAVGAMLRQLVLPKEQGDQ